MPRHMLLKSIIAILGMAAVGWITWKLVSRQDDTASPDNPAPARHQQDKSGDEKRTSSHEET